MVDTNKNSESQPWRIGGPKVALVLVGLIGSGKSTFAKALEMHIPQFRRCNQDDLGNRRAVERLARESLSEGLSVCIDRTNVDETQRAHWINIAREQPGTHIWCLVFDTPLDICADRLDRRTNHPTIKSPEQARMVLHRFANDLRPPAPEEGFDRIMHIKPADHPSPTYTAEDILAILLSVQNSPPPPLSSHQGHAFSSHNQTNLDRFLGADRRFRGGQRGSTFRARGFRGSGNVQWSPPRGTPWASSSGRWAHGDEAPSLPSSGASGATNPASNSGENPPQHQVNRDPPLENDARLPSPHDEDSPEENAVNDAQLEATEGLEQVAEYGMAEKPIVLD